MLVCRTSNKKTIEQTSIKQLNKHSSVDRERGDSNGGVT